jgi:YVTN family beta-propeller protein
MNRRMTRPAAILAASAASLVMLATPNAVAARPVLPAACHLGVIKTIKAGIDGEAGTVSYDQRSGEIYVAGQGGVEAIDSQTYRSAGYITTGKFPNAIGVNPGTNTVYVANAVSNTLSVINGSTNKVTATIRIPPFPLAVDVDRRNARVYVTGYTGTVAIIDALTNTVTGTIQLGDNLEDAALNQVTGLLYATNDSYPGDPGVIFVVNVRTRRVTDRIYPGGSSRPYAIAVNPSTNTIYVTDNPNPGGWGVFVINGSTSKITTRIPISEFYPGFISLNPRNDLVYVVSGSEEENAVIEIDGRDNEILSTLQLSTTDATFIEANAPSRYVYVTAQTGELVALAGCR